MKNFISWLISTSGLSWVTVIVVLAQSAHYAAFFYSFAMFPGWINYLYSLFLTIVFSLPLLIFVTKLGSVPLKSANKSSFEVEELQDRYRGAVNLYMLLDIAINLYTWAIQLDMLSNFEYKLIPKYVVASIVAVVLPLTLKKFSTELKIR